MLFEVERYEGAEPYIFISYSHADSKLVLAIVAAMSKHGYRVWYDAEIEAGVQWKAALANKIAGCAIFLTFISRTFADSECCMQEVRYAHSEHRTIVSVDLEREPLSNELKFLLGPSLRIMLAYADMAEMPPFEITTEFVTICDAEPLFQSCRHTEKSNSLPLKKSGLDVFISYHEDSAGDLAAQIAASLESVGISCWYAKRDIPPGGDFARYIPPQIDACKVFLLILNENVYQSNHIENEVGLAFGRLNHGEKITILPLEIGDFKRESWVKYYLVHTQSVKIPCLDEAHIQEITLKMSNILNKAPTPTEENYNNAIKFSIKPEEPKVKAKIANIKADIQFLATLLARTYLTASLFILIVLIVLLAIISPNIRSTLWEAMLALLGISLE